MSSVIEVRTGRNTFTSAKVRSTLSTNTACLSLGQVLSRYCILITLTCMMMLFLVFLRLFRMLMGRLWWLRASQEKPVTQLRYVDASRISTRLHVSIAEPFAVVFGDTLEKQRGNTDEISCQREFHRMRETVHLCICASLDAQMNMYTTVSVPSKKVCICCLTRHSGNDTSRHQKTDF